MSETSPIAQMKPELDDVTKEMLSFIDSAFGGGLPTAVNLRENGKLAARSRTENIVIETKTDGNVGIDIKIKAGTKNETVRIPVVVTDSGVNDKVYNDFYIGEDCGIAISAGCGIHNAGDQNSEHDGVHRIFIGKNSHVTYNEVHMGHGHGTGKRLLNPETNIYLDEGATIEMAMSQLKGVDSTHRVTKAELKADSHLVIIEKLMTHNDQYAQSDMEFNMIGDGASVQVISRSVARGNSVQVFNPLVVGAAASRGHVQCDAIIMDQAQVKSIPAIEAKSPDAELIHEAAIGKIAGEQIIKLQTFGLTEEEAEAKIIEDFLD